MALAQALRERDAEVAVATRKVAGGSVKDWSPVRQFVSWGSTQFSHILLGDGLRGVTDPLSGMFLVKSSVIRGRELKPLGYKILLEVLARGNYSRVTEVPYVFKSRMEGASKLGPKQSWEFVSHLIRLSLGTSRGRRQWLGGLAGLLGACLNLAVLYFFQGFPSTSVWLAAALAAELGLLFAFLLKAIFLSRASRMVFPWLHGLARYHLSRAGGTLLNVLVFVTLTQGGYPFLPSALSAILLGFLFNFLWRLFQPGTLKGEKA